MDDLKTHLEKNNQYEEFSKFVSSDQGGNGLTERVKSKLKDMKVPNGKIDGLKNLSIKALKAKFPRQELPKEKVEKITKPIEEIITELPVDQLQGVIDFFTNTANPNAKNVSSLLTNLEIENTKILKAIMDSIEALHNEYYKPPSIQEDIQKDLETAIKRIDELEQELEIEKARSVQIRKLYDEKKITEQNIIQELEQVRKSLLEKDNEIKNLQSRIEQISTELETLKTKGREEDIKQIKDLEEYLQQARSDALEARSEVRQYMDKTFEQREK